MELEERIELEKIIQLAEKAGQAILAVYKEKNFGVTLKKDASPVTHADKAAHQLILDGLKGLVPKLPVLSEESPEISYEERKDWAAYFLVDPLDGTKEFIKRNGEFTVNIALIEDRNPILGVVHAPASGKTYFASRGQGAFRIMSGGQPVRISVSHYGNGKIRIIASRSHVDPSLARFLPRFKEYEYMQLGSSLKFCLVAEGSAHLYPKWGPTMEWDTAAGQCIVEEAGGSVTDLQGDPLVYNKPDLQNPHFLAGGASAFQWWQYVQSREGERLP